MIWIVATGGPLDGETLPVPDSAVELRHESHDGSYVVDREAGTLMWHAPAPDVDAGLALARVAFGASLQLAARENLRLAILQASEAGVRTGLIAEACGRSQRFVQLVVEGKRLRPRGES